MYLVHSCIHLHFQHIHPFIHTIFYFCFSSMILYLYVSTFRHSFINLKIRRCFIFPFIQSRTLIHTIVPATCTRSSIRSPILTFCTYVHGARIYSSLAPDVSPFRPAGTASSGPRRAARRPPAAACRSRRRPGRLPRTPSRCSPRWGRAARALLARRCERVSVRQI